MSINRTITIQSPQSIKAVEKKDQVEISAQEQRTAILSKNQLSDRSSCISWFSLWILMEANTFQASETSHWIQKLFCLIVFEKPDAPTDRVSAFRCSYTKNGGGGEIFGSGILSMFDRKREKKLCDASKMIL